MMLAAGGGISIYEGILHLIHPRPMENPAWNYVVLGAAAVFEGTSLGISVHQFKKRDGQGYFSAHKTAPTASGERPSPFRRAPLS